MKYTVTFWTRGRPVWRGKISAKTAKAALTQASAGAVTSYSHASVQNDKEVVRYDRKFRKINGDIFLFKTHVMYKPSLMLMIGNMPEIYRFDDNKLRDQIYEELCTTYTSAESAKAEEEPTDIIASSVETSGSKSGLTCQKILNGSVTTATWQARLTQSSIDKPFGSVSVANTAKPTWSTGSAPSPSKPSQIFLATVKSTLPQPGTSFVTVDMQDLIGQTIIVYLFDNKPFPEYCYAGAGWHWKKEWLDFETVYACVKNIPTWEEKDTLTFTPEMVKPADKVLRLNVCQGSFPPHYTEKGGYCYALDWLQPMGKQQFEDNYQATEKYLTKDKFDQMAAAIYGQKKYVKNETKAIKRAILKIKGKEKPMSKYAYMPLAADDDEPTKVNDNQMTAIFTGEEFSINKEIYLDQLKKLNEAMEKNLEQMKFKYYGSPFIKSDKKGFPPVSS